MSKAYKLKNGLTATGFKIDRNGVPRTGLGHNALSSGRKSKTRH